MKGKSRLGEFSFKEGLLADSVASTKAATGRALKRFGLKMA
jgi:hypothetical protein